MLASSVRSGPRAFTSSRKSVIPNAKFSHAKVLDSFSQDQLKPNLRPLRVGDTVKLGLAVAESKGAKSGSAVRTQTIDGVIIGDQSSGVNKTYLFRRVFQGIGIELTLPIHAPVVQSLEFVKSGKARRAKLYYLRKRVGKSAKLKEKVLETAARRLLAKGDAARAAEAAALAAPAVKVVKVKKERRA